MKDGAPNPRGRFDCDHEFEEKRTVSVELIKLTEYPGPNGEEYAVIRNSEADCTGVDCYKIMSYSDIVGYADTFEEATEIIAGGFDFE